MKRTWMIVFLSIMAGIATASAATISGIVANAASTPLANIQIALRTTTTTQGSTVARDTTDATGAFSITCDSIGTYVVRSTDPTDAYTQKYDTIVLDGTDKIVNVVMTAIEYFSLSGTITDSVTAAAISGAIVSLDDKTDTTGADGTYSFDSATTGTTTLRVSATGYTTKSTSVTATTTAAQVVDVKLVGTQYFSLSGTITDSVTAAAISGAIVRFGSSSSAKTDTTGADGTYSFDSATTGTTTLRVSATGYTTKSTSVTATTTTAQVVDVMLVAAAVSSVSGTITDTTTGTAIAGAIVTISSNGTTSVIDTTGTDGKYSFAGVVVSTNEYTVSVSATGYLIKSSEVTVSDTTPLTLDLALTTAIYFSVSGTVTDSATGLPIAGAAVVLRSSSRTTIDSVVTDATGAYTVDSAVTGSYIKVTATGYTTARDTLTGTTSAAQTVAFALTASAAVRKIYSSQSKRDIVVTNGRLVLKNLTDAGMITLFNLKGEIVLTKSFTSCTEFSMQLDKKISRGSYLLTVSQKNAVLCQNVIVK